MSYNGSGDYSLPAGQPVVTGTTISSTTHNNLANDLATAFDTAFCRDGQAAATALFDMGGFRITNMGAATAAAHAVIASQVQNNTMTLLASVAGTNTVTGTATPTPAAYASGQKFTLVPAETNTGATTLNVSSLGAKNVFWNGAACVGGELRQSIPAVVEYDGTQFHIIANGFNAPFLDTHAVVAGSADSTKKVRFEVDGLTTATTRVLTVQDQDMTLGIVLGTEQATTSGTAIDFTGIPSWAKQVKINFVGVSTNGTSRVRVQLGASGGIETAGYLGCSTIATDGNVITGVSGTVGCDLEWVNASHVAHGTLTLSLQDSSDNTWLIAGTLGLSAGTVSTIQVAYSKALSGVLDRVRITTVNGTDAFDAGAINISYS